MISVLVILLITPSLLLFLFPGSVCADAIPFIDVGLGNLEIKTKGNKFRSISKNSRRHIGLGIDLEKEEYPLSVSFRWSFFETDEKSEKWTIGPLHENRLDIHGETFEILGFFTLYNFASSKDAIHVKPFIGGGLGYKRFKFERKGLNENILTPPLPEQYFLGNQGITAIGATPLIGFSMELPKFKVECNVDLRWTLLALKSNINYHDFSGGSDVMYPVNGHTSGSSLLTGMQIVKSWESFSFTMGFVWEKTRIDDKSFSYDPDKDGRSEKPFPFPEFEIIQAFGRINLRYLF